MLFLSRMPVTLQERVLLVMLFYVNVGKAAAGFRKFCLIKNLLKEPLFPQVLKRMTDLFEKTGGHRVQTGSVRKPTRPDIAEDVASFIVKQSMDNVAGCTRER